MLLKAQKGRGKKTHLLLDGEYQITTDSEFWTLHGLPDGTELTEQEWEELVQQIERTKAVNKCYDLLSRRDHSKKELLTKLLRTVSAENARYAVELMEEKGYLDDEKYARKLCAYLLESKNLSKRHLAAEMAKRGLSRDLISQVLEEVEVDPVSQIVQLLQTKFAAKLQAENGVQKVTAALLRKGFTYADIKSAFYRLETDDYAL